VKLLKLVLKLFLCLRWGIGGCQAQQRERGREEIEEDEKRKEGKTRCRSTGTYL
jgi:hypothetical protein